MFERQIERRGLDRVLGLRELGLGQHLVDARDGGVDAVHAEGLRDHLHDRLLHAASHQEEQQRRRKEVGVGRRRGQDDEHGGQQQEHLRPRGGVQLAHAAGVEPGGPLDVAHELACVRLEAPECGQAAVEHLDHRHAVHELDRGAVELLPALRHGPLACRALGASQRAAQQEERNDDGNHQQQRQPPIDEREGGDGQQRQGDGAHRVGEVVGDEPLDLLHVVVEHLLDLPLAHLVEIA